MGMLALGDGILDLHHYVVFLKVVCCFLLLVS